MKVSQYVPNCIVTVYFLKLHAPHLPHDAGRIPVRKKYLVRKYRPRETKKATHLLVACPASPKAHREPLTFSGRVKLHVLSLDFGFAKPSFSDLALGLVFLCVCVVGPGLFGDGCEEILPHHILGSLQEFKMEALARGNTQVGL